MPSTTAGTTRLVALEAEHPELQDDASPTRRVGGLSDKFQKVAHLRPMGSLEKVTTDEALAKWADDVRAARLGRARRVRDGAEDRRVRGLAGLRGRRPRSRNPRRRRARRGDHAEPADDQGDPLTCSRSTAIGRPPCSRSAVRCMPLSSFNRLNERLAAEEEDDAEPAQRCGGSLRQLNPQITADRARIDLGLRDRTQRGLRAAVAVGDPRWLRARGFRTNPTTQSGTSRSTTSPASARSGRRAVSSTTRSTGS